jgi:IPT/TIG domain/PQQ-like domain
MRLSASRLPQLAILGFAALMASATAALPLTAAADWPTYHRDLGRTGNDGGEPAVTALSRAWTSPNLDGAVYAEPLAVGGKVIVATEGDSVYALDEVTGGVLWRTNLGTPVRLSSLPCGNIDPVGITGTPVVDTTLGIVYAVAFTRPGQYRLVGLDLNNGNYRFPPVAINPSGFNPMVQGQRGALTLSQGLVYVPFGGWYGDCGAYHGWVVAVPAGGSGSQSTYRVPAGGGGIWAPSGPAVDGSGNIFIATGNGATGTAPDGTDSVIRLSPTLVQQDFFAPSDWARLNATDTDLGSVGPTLLNGGQLFQVGKEGVGYVLNAGGLGGVGGQKVSFKVCSAESLGGIAYMDPYLYVPCRDGLYALTLGAGPTLAAKWSDPGYWSGPPIVTGGIVWAINVNSGDLNGFDPVTGIKKFTTSLGSVTHFATPAANDGFVFVPAGSGVQAFSQPPTLTALGAASGPNCGGTTVTITGTNLVGATAVKFGVTDALSYSVTSNTQVTAIAPQGTGTVDITVVTARGTTVASPSDRFTYTTPSSAPPPVVARLTPSTAPFYGGTGVTVIGGCLSGTTVVTFGTTPGTSVAVVSPNQVTAIAPAEPAGFTDITVMTPGGTSATTAADRFTFVEGYWMVASDGGIFAFGNAGFNGSTGNIALTKPMAGLSHTPDAGGYWLVASDGGVFTFGDAGFFGSTGSLRLNKPVVGMASTPDGKGYWLVAADGGIFTFGDAVFFGSTGSLRLNKPIVDMAATPDGKGYWLVAADGGIFTFGNAGFFGSTGSLRLNRPVNGMAPTADGKGYWLVASDGGIFTFGDAGFFGSTGSVRLNQPVVAMAATHDGKGYWLVASDGGIFTFGSAMFFGSTGGITLNQPVAGIAAT